MVNDIATDYMNDGSITPLRLGILLSIVLTILFLVPLSGKAFTVDDPLFLWAADWIKSHPADFYGFTVNWVGYKMPMYEATFNPPLTSYWIAFVQLIFGNGERVLHIAFLLPAIGAITGTYMVARECGARPLISALATLFTPAFLVSATSVMSDVAMLCFWVWSVYLWMAGMKAHKHTYMLASAIFISLGFLTKYYALSLVPLLIVYSVVRQKRIRPYLLYMLIPLSVMLGYEWVTKSLYGAPLLELAHRFTELAESNRSQTNLSALVKTFAYLGAGSVTIAILAATDLTTRARMLVVSLLLLLSGLATATRVPSEVASWFPKEFSTSSAALLAAFIFAALVLVFFTIKEVKYHRDHISILLFLWIAGTLVFAFSINWTINIRSVLPAVPALAIVAGRLPSRRNPPEKGRALLVVSVLLAASGFSFLVAWNDYRWANSQRDVALYMCKKYGHDGDRVWYAGHWGFQYYMQQCGSNVRAIDAESKFAAGDKIILMPLGMNGGVAVPNNHVSLIAKVVVKPWRGVETFQPLQGISFYSSLKAVMPYTFGIRQRDVYPVLEVKN